MKLNQFKYTEETNCRDVGFSGNIERGPKYYTNGKFVVLRTYFTKSEILGWINGLVCILSGQFETSAGVFKGTGYELIL